MRTRRLYARPRDAATAALAVMVLSACTSAPPAAEQPGSQQPASTQQSNATPVLTQKPVGNGTPVPRTADGRADLSGLWDKALHANMALPVEPLPFTPAGLKAFNDVVTLVDPLGRCVPPGVPRVNNLPYPFQIVQSAHMVLFLYEAQHNFRVIYTDGRGHRSGLPPSLMGDSIGRWEGDTLVIDTVNLTDRTWLDSHGNRHSDALHVIERWTRLSANELWYEATVDDPKFYTHPWTTGWIVPLAPPGTELLEYFCTDNNRALEDGLLRPGPVDGSGRDGTALATAPANAP